MMGAGRFRHRISFLRQSSEVGKYGNSDGAFEPFFTALGNVRETPGKERVASGSVENLRTATIRIWSTVQSRGLTEADQAVARGETWNILGIARADDAGRMLDLLVEAGGAQ